MNDYTRFIHIIEEYLALFRTLLGVEQQKLEAALKNQVTFVEDCMNQEQAAILKMRGLEQRRTKEQTALGLDGQTFRQILEAAPAETAAILRPMFDELSGLIRSFQSVSGSAMEAIQLNLHMIQSELAAREAAHRPAPPAAETAESTKRFTSRSV